MAAHSVIVSSLLLWTSCISAWRPVAAGKFVVLPETEAQSLVRQCSRSAPEIEGTWQIPENDTALLERDLRQLQRLYAAGCCFRGGRIRNVDDYLRQYAGVIVRGQRYIYINAFAADRIEAGPATATAPRWKESAFVACDGGSAYWGALYSPASRRFFELSINGIV